MQLAYSYLRFSSPEQAHGDTVRRQTENRERWLAANPSVRLDTSLVMTDAGRSAFRRKDPDTYALAEFVKHIKSGRVEPGSFLLVENLDRLSREDAGEATELFLSIVNRGIVVVQLAPVVMEFRKPVNIQSLMFAIVELSRGHSESAMKSERVGAAWARKRKEACSRVVTRRLPGWVKFDEGTRRLVLDPEGAATVRRVFDLALQGFGVYAIAKTLNDEGVPVMGRKEITKRGQSHLPADKRERTAVLWNETVVYHVLKSRATFGEYQPCKGRGSERRPAGDPIPDYYPAVIARETFLAAETSLRSRSRKGSGRRGQHVNLFAGLLVDARDGGSLTYKHLKRRSSTVIPVGAKQGKGTPWTSFPAVPLERAVRSMLLEVSAADVTGGDTVGRKVEVLSGKKAELETLVEAWTKKMDNPDTVDIVAGKLAELNSRLKGVAAELADAQREAASPVSEALGELKSLAGLDPEQDTDELRVRIRAAVRRIVERICCVFATRERDRLAILQVWFKGADRFRVYYVMLRPERNPSTGRLTQRWWATSVRHRPGKGRGVLPPTIDLREPKDAERFLPILMSYDPTAEKQDEYEREHTRTGTV